MNGVHKLSREEIKYQAIRSHLIENGMMFVGSIFLAVLLVKSDLFHSLIEQSEQARLFGSFFVGIFFTSLFTVVPATAAFFEIAKENSIFLVAFFGAFGAVFGDLIIFHLLKTHLTDEFIMLFSRPKKRRWKRIFHLRSMQWLFSFLGFLTIASPLPDELGLVLMGITEIKMKYFIVISYTANFLGILIVGIIAQQF